MVLCSIQYSTVQFDIYLTVLSTVFLCYLFFFFHWTMNSGVCAQMNSTDAAQCEFAVFTAEPPLRPATVVNVIFHRA